MRTSATRLAAAPTPAPATSTNSSGAALSAPNPAEPIVTAVEPGLGAGGTQPASAHAGTLAGLLTLALLAALLAWWTSMRRARQLGRQAERLARQQRFLKSAHGHLQQRSQQLQQLSMHDPLTGTLNRQAFAAELRERIEHLARYHQPLTLIMFDLDHFKTINDRHGHLLGDAALKRVVGVVREHLVSDDLFGRFGGDEFMIARSGHTPEATVVLAETLRAAVARPPAAGQSPIPALTLSMGLAQADAEHGYQPDELFARADAALYCAKQRGRNAVVVAAGDLPGMPATTAMRRHL